MSDAASVEEKQFAKVLAQLEEIYTFREVDAVVDFLKKHPFLHTLLLEAPQQIERYFPDAPLFLEIDIDPEGSGEPKLLLVIGTRLDADTTFEKLNVFNDEWWLPNLKTTRRVLKTYIEFV